MAEKRKGLGKYVDPRTDFGIKFYFGREENKQFLIDFLNGLFQGERVIKDLTYAPPEQDGEHREARRVVFDLYCTGMDGEHFIIEMQQLHQGNFKDRILFYSSRLISNLVEKGWRGNRYLLPEVYFIGILEFALEEADDVQYFYDVALMDRKSSTLFYSKLGFKLVVLPNFNKREEELEGDMEQWLYLLKNLSMMQEMSKFLDKRIFSRIFEVGEIASLNKEERMLYEASLKQKWDSENILETARIVGHREGHKAGHKAGHEAGHKAGHKAGLKEAKYEVVRNLIKKTEMSDEQIAEVTSLSVDEIRQIRCSDV